MTNPGHIDPGYHGPLRFTIINMGRQDFYVRQGDAIVSVLFFRLAAPVRVDWLKRHDGNPGTYPTQEDIDIPSPDFVNVTKRAKEIAVKEVGRAELKVKLLQAWLPFIAAVIIAFGTVVPTWIRPAWKEPVAQVQADVQTLKATVDVTSLKSRVDALERDFKASHVPASRSSIH